MRIPSIRHFIHGLTSRIRKTRLASLKLLQGTIIDFSVQEHEKMFG